MDSLGIPPETSNSYCLPGRAGRTPIVLVSTTFGTCRYIAQRAWQHCHLHRAIMLISAAKGQADGCDDSRIAH